MHINNPNSLKYLSLKSAAELYGYTRDHLGLMIRKGKLKGTKIGNYYVTTNDWMIEYVKNFANLSHPTSKNKLSNKLLMEISANKGMAANVYTAEADKYKTNSVSDGTDKKENEDHGSKSLLKTDFDDIFKKEISKELSKLSEISGNIVQIKNETNKSFDEKNIEYENPVLRINLDHPFVILPIREMKINERDNILRRIGNKEEKEDIA